MTQDQLQNITEMEDRLSEKKAEHEYSQEKPGLYFATVENITDTCEENTLLTVFLESEEGHELELSFRDTDSGFSAAESFLNSIGCTFSDLSLGFYEQILLSYSKDSGWRLISFDSYDEYLSLDSNTFREFNPKDGATRSEGWWTGIKALIFIGSCLASVGLGVTLPIFIALGFLATDFFHRISKYGLVISGYTLTEVEQ